MQNFGIKNVFYILKIEEIHDKQKPYFWNAGLVYLQQLCNHLVQYFGLPITTHTKYDTKTQWKLK